jgi:iron complex outermembrane receptor protein
LIDVGGRYRFRLGPNAASLRIQVSNLTNLDGFQLSGAGAYTLIPGRVASVYLTIDF